MSKVGCSSTNLPVVTDCRPYCEDDTAIYPNVTIARRIRAAVYCVRSVLILCIIEESSAKLQAP